MIQFKKDPSQMFGNHTQRFQEEGLILSIEEPLLPHRIEPDHVSDTQIARANDDNFGKFEEEKPRFTMLKLKEITITFIEGNQFISTILGIQVGFFANLMNRGYDPNGKQYSLILMILGLNFGILIS